MFKKLFGRSEAPQIAATEPTPELSVVLDGDLSVETTVVPHSRDTAMRIRFASDAAYCDELMKDEKIAGLADKITQRNDFGTQRVSLLATRLRVTDAVMPDINRLVNKCIEILHLEDKNIETYVYPDHNLNACCMYFDEQHIFVLLSSGIVERMNERELMFVIGHEFGHALYNHHCLPAYGILSGDSRVSAGHAMQLMSWSRRAEISADRAGLLCAQDLQASTTAFIKLCSGLKEPQIKFDIEAYLSQMSDIEALASSKQNSEDCYSSHPFNPIRVLALNYFWQSQMLGDILGHQANGLSTEQVDEGIHGLLDFMEATPPEEMTSGVIIWGGLWVGMADGQLDESETCAISDVCDAEKVKAAREEMEQSGDRPKACTKFAREKFIEAADKCKKQLNNNELCNVIQKLVVVARADQVVAKQELEVLKEASSILGVEPGFVDQILAFLE